MSLFTVSSEKERALLERMASLGVAESDLRETFVRSSGPGGQKVNKTSSCVQLVHIPTGLSVKCQRERSQALNRFLARRLLLDRIEKLQKGFLRAGHKVNIWRFFIAVWHSAGSIKHSRLFCSRRTIGTATPKVFSGTLLCPEFFACTLPARQESLHFKMKTCAGATFLSGIKKISLYRLNP